MARLRLALEHIRQLCLCCWSLGVGVASVCSAGPGLFVGAAAEEVQSGVHPAEDLCYPGQAQPVWLSASVWQDAGAGMDAGA